MEFRSLPLTVMNPAPYNPRRQLRSGDPEYEALRRSIREFGLVDPIVWNETTGNIVGGHQRYFVLRDEGVTDTDVSVVRLDPEREKALNLALNKIEGGWDEEKLAALLADLEGSGLDMALTGFGQDEIDALLRGAPAPGSVQEDDFDAEAELEKIQVPVTRPGDLWLLGRHRLLCGDATNPEHVRRLMAGQPAAMVFTDPPYNVDYTGATKDQLKILNDKMAPDQFRAFLLSAYQNMIASTRPGGAIYVCYGEAEGINFRTAMVEAGWLLKQIIIWVKQAFVLGRQDYQWQHEPILYGWKPGASHYWYGGRKQTTVIDNQGGLAVAPQADGSVLLTVAAGDQTVVVRAREYEVVHADTTVWRVDRPVRSEDHPTMKPIEVPARGIRNSSQSGDIVLDSFLGAGSTLMAAEQLERSCYGMELAPRYCDVIIRRWEKWTGQKGVREDGLQFPGAA